MTPSRAARSRFIFLEIASYKRCSRPLCSSQTTTPYHTPHTHKHAWSLQPGNQKHTNPQPPPQEGARHHGPVASGPNSVPNTKPPIPHQHPSRNPHKGRNRTKHRKRPAAAIRWYSTLEHPPQNNRLRNGLYSWQTPAPHTRHEKSVGAP